MKYYQQLELIPDAEISAYALWEKVFQQVHLALVEAQGGDSNTVGISFPDYNSEQFLLGTRLRFFAQTEEELTRLNLERNLNRFVDYVNFSSIRQVPDNVTDFAIYKRVRPKSSNECLARRKAKREGMTYEDALAYLNSRKESFTTLPFINLKSLSSGKRFKLFIDCCPSQDTSQPAIFDTYGLNSQYALPSF